MTSRGQRLRVRAFVMTVGVLVCSIMPSVSASRATLPPDDGAPPEEYEPSDEAGDPEGGRPRRRRRRPRSGSSLPPLRLDNAVPDLRRIEDVVLEQLRPTTQRRPHPHGRGLLRPVGTRRSSRSRPARSATRRRASRSAARPGGDISGNRVSVRGRSGYVYYYGHLDTILVAADQPVEKGQVIGTVGRTGNAACSRPHLHFEVKCGENGDPFDPYPAGRVGSRQPPPAAWPSTERSVQASSFRAPADRTSSPSSAVEAIRQRTWTSSIGSRRRGAPWTASPRPTPMPPHPGPGGTPQVFVRGTDYAIYQLYWNGSAWGGISLGGSARRPVGRVLQPEPARRVLPRRRLAALPAGLGRRRRAGPGGTASAASRRPIPTPPRRARPSGAGVRPGPRQRDLPVVSGTDRAGSASTSAGPAPRVRRRRTPAPSASTCSAGDRHGALAPSGDSAPVGPRGHGSTATSSRTRKPRRAGRASPQVFGRGVDRRFTSSSGTVRRGSAGAGVSPEGHAS